MSLVDILIFFGNLVANFFFLLPIGYEPITTENEKTRIC